MKYKWNLGVIPAAVASIFIIMMLSSTNILLGSNAQFPTRSPQNNIINSSYTNIISTNQTGRVGGGVVLSGVGNKSTLPLEIVRDQVVNKTIQIPPGNLSKPFIISVPIDAVNARLIGSYSIEGGIVPAIHLYMVDTSKCATPIEPSSCSSYIIDQINTSNYLNMTLMAGKIYALFFLNEANLPGELKTLIAKFFLDHNPLLIRIKAGQANSTISINQFFPSDIEAKVGQNITWYNPSEVPVLHTITFVLDNKYKAGLFAPFSIPNSTISILPGSNSDPTLVPTRNGTGTIIGVNGRAFNSIVIDSAGNTKLMSPNANYTVNGDEKYINSGFLLPKGQEKAFPGSSNRFTIAFNKVGKYDYFDIFHPGMTGRIVVK